MLRPGEHRRSVAGFDDAAAMHHDDPAAQMVDHGEVVADEKIGHAVALLQVGHQVQHLRLHRDIQRSEEHTSELQSLMRISYAVFCLKKKKKNNTITEQQK